MDIERWCFMKLWNRFLSLPKRGRDSMLLAGEIIGLISTLASILGVSLRDIAFLNLLTAFLTVLGLFVLIAIIVWFLIGWIHRKSINLDINNTSVRVAVGDIFSLEGLRVIGCDTCFRTLVDDKVISKNSLHGRLILEHGNKSEIQKIVTQRAEELGISRNHDGLYEFPLGTIIPYKSSVDNKTYLLLSMTSLNSDNESHTNMSKYEGMLMKMWSELNRVYASHDIVLPLLGSGISRFDNGPKDHSSLLKCMICTLKNSG